MIHNGGCSCWRLPRSGELYRRMCFRCMVTPPVGTVRDPFMGTGSIGRGSVMEGRGFLGTDLEPEHVEIASHRIAAAERQVAQEAEAARVAAEKAARQPDLFQEGHA